MSDIYGQIQYIVKILYEPTVLASVREFNDFLQQNNVAWRLIIYGGAAMQAYFPGRIVNDIVYDQFYTADFDIKLVPLRVPDEYLNLEDANHYIYEFYKYIGGKLPDIFSFINEKILKGTNITLANLNNPMLPVRENSTNKLDTRLYPVLYTMYKDNQQLAISNVVDISYMTIERLDLEHAKTKQRFFESQGKGDIIVPYILYEDVPLAALGEVIYSTLYMMSLPESELRGRGHKYTRKFNSLINSLNYFNTLLSCDTVSQVCNRCFKCNKSYQNPYFTINYPDSNMAKMSNVYQNEYYQRLELVLEPLDRSIDFFREIFPYL